MGKNQQARVKLPSQMTKALYKEYVTRLHDFQPENDHQKLLQVHALDTCQDIKGSLFLKPDQTEYTIGFTGPEAVAFVQWWALMPVMIGTLGQVAIAQVIAAIDQVAKRPRKLSLTTQSLI